eukprot:GFUD01035982.1.p1 GENE.GFUD01035982.1~~GFUD01035982.1.p1  ORF type:complete len:298 (+),score=93.34 GFUD01035982.1:60-953(+)
MSASRPGYESALARSFEEKEKSRRKLGRLWQEVLARGNREELEQLQLLVKVNREKLIEATEENEKLDKELETAVRKRGKPSLASDEKKILEASIAYVRDLIAQGERNLAGHEEELAKMNFHGVARELYEAKKKDVEGYKEMHRVSMVRMLAIIDSKQARLQEIASEEIQKRKIPVKEQDMIVPKVIKTEEEVEEIYPAYSCPHCPRQLTSAATLVSHLVKHFPADSLLHCPFPGCPFWSELEGLTRHNCSTARCAHSSCPPTPPWWTMRGSTTLPGGTREEALQPADEAVQDLPQVF